MISLIIIERYSLLPKLVFRFQYSILNIDTTSSWIDINLFFNGTNLRYIHKFKLTLIFINVDEKKNWEFKFK